MKLVICQAIYSYEDYLVVPHFTAEVGIMQCSIYKTKKQLKRDFGKEDAKKFTENSYLTYENVKYYDCDVKCINTEKMELESDLSKLVHYNEEF